MSRTPKICTAAAAAASDSVPRTSATPEEQIEIYRAARDGSVFGMLAALASHDGAIDINVRLDALWHPPGPESTALHVAAAAAQVEMVGWLLARGADARIAASGKTPGDYIGAAPYEGAWAARPGAAEEIRALLARPWLRPDSATADE